MFCSGLISIHPIDNLFRQKQKEFTIFLLIERISKFYKMPRDPEVDKAIHRGAPYSVMYTKKKKKLRLDAIREWNGKFDEKLAWAQ